MLTINLDLTLRIFLYIIIIIFFIFAIILLLKIISFFSKLDSILKKSKTEIENSILELPNLVEDTCRNLENSNVCL